MALKSETLVDNYIILEEAKIRKIWLETREEGQKYEEKGGRENRKEIITECWRQVKEEDEGNQERERYYMKNGIAMEEVKEIRTERIKKYCLKNRR